MKSCHNIANDSFMESPLPAKLDSIKFLGTRYVLGGKGRHYPGLFFSGVCGRIKCDSNFKVFIPTDEISGSKTSGDKLISIYLFSCLQAFMPAGMLKKGYLTNLLGFIFY